MNHHDTATTIKKQIGIDTWLAVSARSAQFFALDNGDTVFKFRFGSRYGLGHWVEVTYRSARDTYDLSAYKVHRNGCKSVFGTYTDVYADSLSFLIRDFNNEAVFA
jgi:hypothetical protein